MTPHVNNFTRHRSGQLVVGSWWWLVVGQRLAVGWLVGWLVVGWWLVAGGGWLVVGG